MVVLEIDFGDQFLLLVRVQRKGKPQPVLDKRKLAPPFRELDYRKGVLDCFNFPFAFLRCSVFLCLELCTETLHAV